MHFRLGDDKRADRRRESGDPRCQYVSSVKLTSSRAAGATVWECPGISPANRLDPVFEAKSLNSTTHDPVLRRVETVRLAEVRPDQTPGTMVYEPGHPDANAEGYVEYPNVNTVTEMVNMMTASRAYEAGITSIESVKAMARAALRIGK